MINQSLPHGAVVITSPCCGEPLLINCPCPLAGTARENHVLRCSKCRTNWAGTFESRSMGPTRQFSSHTLERLGTVEEK